VQRVIVFVDYRRAYLGARQRFVHGDSSATIGHIDPLKLGELLVKRRCVKFPSTLEQVRIYRGAPDSDKQLAAETR
jgi:hypothetical protein